jgi:N-acetylglucosamine kinase-like BadF-type ATPase
MLYFLGVDSGGTKSEVALLAGDGAVLNTAMGAPLHMHIRANARVIHLLRDLVDYTLKPTGVTWEQIDHFGFGLSGADFADEVRGQHRAFCRALKIAPERLTLVNDGVVALWGGSDAERAVILQLGTAFTSAYRARFGDEAPLDHLNAGVQFEIRRYLLTTVARIVDGREKPSILRQLVREHYGFADETTMLKTATRGKLDRVMTLFVISVLNDAVAQGDEVAIRLVHDAADYYLRDVVFLIDKVGGGEVDVVLGGGLLLNGPPLLRDVLAQKIKAARPPVSVHTPHLSPAIGGAVMAAFYAGQDHHAVFRRAVATNK